MARVTIFRVEHTESRLGPFGLDNPIRDALSDHTSRNPLELPEADEDCQGFTDRHLCGVHDRHLLDTWFGPFKEQLLAAGYGLFEYQPLERNVLTSASGLQVAFQPYAATPRTQLDW